MKQTVHAMTVVMGIALLTGSCSETLAPDDGEEGFDVVVGPLNSAATHAGICLKYLDSGSICPTGVLVQTSVVGATMVARASFPRVAEDVTQVQAYAWAKIIPTGTGFPAQSYYSTDVGVEEVQVTSNSHQGVNITTSSAGGGIQLSTERPILNADYEFDEASPYAGSLDGSNITRLVIDNLTLDSTVTVAVIAPDGMGSNHNGIFTRLPDVTSGEVWADPLFWPYSLTGVELDANHDLVLYLVAKPGAPGFVDFVQMSPNVSALMYLYVRTSGIASIAVQAE